MHTWMTGVALVLGVAAQARPSETERVHAHLARVEHELRAETPAGLTPEQAEARARIIDLLHAYAEARRYPMNTVSAELTPIFVDAFGTRCAMAALIEQTGGAALVQRVAATNNLAFIGALSNDAALREWLHTHGITLVEAARIQPSYSPVESQWSLAGGAFGTVQAGTEVVLAPGVRLGARYRTFVPDQSACDSCVDRSWAVFGEYRREYTLSHTSGNTLSLLGAYSPNSFHDLVRVNLLLGPSASLDDRGHLAFAGGQVAGGVSLRNNLVPLFAELAVTLGAGAGFVARGALNLGVLW